jgi:Tfp pilus assembly protein PilF
LKPSICYVFEPREAVPMTISRCLCITLFAALSAAPAFAQSTNARERARAPYEKGLEQLQKEAFDAAAKSFEAAIAIDDTFDMAYYMLGRAHLARRQYAAAVYALEKCRDLHQAAATRGFADKQEGQRLRRERLAELDQLIVDTQAAAARPENSTRRFSLLEQVRQYEERKRQIQDLDRSEDLSPARLVPGFVSLSLGSAHFRGGNLAEAENAYLAALAADGKIAEAHNNLAVVYMETGRFEQAEASIKAAERAGLRVSPALKDELTKRKRGR